MKINLIILSFLTLFVGCSSSNNINKLQTAEIEISTDHVMMSQKNTVIARVKSLLVDELQKKELASFLYKDTWVYSIQSTLRWPNKLEVKLREHQPLARWRNEGYLTHSGLIINPSENNLDLVLVTLTGPENKKFQLLELSRSIQSQLNRYGENLLEVDLSTLGYIKATTTKGVILVFNVKNFRDQLERLEDLISFELISGRLDDIKNLDLRYKNGISVLY